LISQRDLRLAVIALCVAAVLVVGILALTSGGGPDIDDVEAKASEWFGHDVNCKVEFDIPEDLGEGEALVCGDREFILHDDGTVYGPDGVRIP
jgi:hypothetical protein